jgi:hypothetical protein
MEAATTPGVAAITLRIDGGGPLGVTVAGVVTKPVCDTSAAASMKIGSPVAR